MTRLPDPPPPASPSRGPRLVIGKRTIGGPIAWILTLLIPALCVTLIVWHRPSIGMLLAGGVWLGFIVFWSATAGRRGSLTLKESPRSRALRQYLTTLGLLLLFLSIPGLRGRYLLPNPWHVPAGLGIMAAATLFHVWARGHLGRNWSSEVAIRPGHELVRTGPYRFVRHPIYTAIIGLAIGTALVSGRVLSLAGALLFAIAYLGKLRLEERALQETFGAEWQEYRKRSWALLPGVF